MPVAASLNQDFFKTWTPEMAYVLGYFAADGCMLTNKRGGHFIEFTSTDRILLEHVKRVSGASHRISERVRKHIRCKTAYRLQIGSGEWYSDLLALGFTPRKSNTLTFPEVPELCLGDFVRGYFDGDGCVYFSKLKYYDRAYKRWILLTLFTSGSRSFLESLHFRLRSHGIEKGTIAKKARGFELRFSHRDSLALYQLMYDTAQVATTFLPRKREKLEDAIQVLGLDKSCGRSTTG